MPTNIPNHSPTRRARLRPQCEYRIAWERIFYLCVLPVLMWASMFIGALLAMSE